MWHRRVWHLSADTTLIPCYTITMLYFIGGIARSGKSTLAKTVRSVLPAAQSLSGDAFGQSVKIHLPVNRHAGLNLKKPSEYIEYYSSYADHEITNLQAQAQAIAPYFARYAEAIELEGPEALVIDSVDIWPSFIENFGHEHRTVFMLDTSENQWERIAAFDDPYSWMLKKKLTEDQLKAWAKFSAKRSQLLKQLCTISQIPYVDIADSSYEEAQRRGLEILLNDRS